MYTLYCIENSESNTKYIGMTNKNISQRFYQHLYHADNGTKTKLYDAMRSYGTKCFSIHELDTYSTREECAKAEINTIAECKELEIPLYNMTNGGDGGFAVPEHKIEEWKAKLSKAREGGKPFLGKQHTDENKKLFSEVSNKYWDENRKFTVEQVTQYKSFKEANTAIGISKTHYYRLKNRALANDQS